MAERKSREEKMSDIQEKILEGTKQIFESDKYKEAIATFSRFPHYSINNCILIASQRPDASYVCGFKKWKEFNRTVNRGEHGIMIIAPVKVKADCEKQVFDAENKLVRGEDGKPVTETVTREFQSYRPAYVFAYEQTNGEPLPRLATQLTANVEDYGVLKDILMEVAPVPITFEPIKGETNGYFSPGEQRIVVKENLPELQTIKTMIHEIAHATLKHGSEEDKWDRETKEVQAESVAYWVTQLLGMDTSEYSFYYIGGWSKDKEVPELKEHLELIKTTADQLSKDIEMKLEERQQLDQEQSASVERSISHHR